MARVFFSFLLVASTLAAAPHDLVIVGKRNEASEDGRKLGNVAVKLLRKRPGEAVLTQGDAGTAFYVVARGRVRV